MSCLLFTSCKKSRIATTLGSTFSFWDFAIHQRAQSSFEKAFFMIYLCLARVQLSSKERLGMTRSMACRLSLGGTGKSICSREGERKRAFFLSFYIICMSKSEIKKKGLESPEKQSSLLFHLNLAVFKIYPCQKREKHNHKRCAFYHSYKDRKRPVELLNTQICLLIQKGESCVRGDQCHMAHNRVQHLYNKDRYKMKFCTTYPDNISHCEYGDYCSFAHSEQDIRVPLIHNYIFDMDFFIFHYKTVFCPFNLTKHDMAKCVYAHNWQDFRRPPQKFRYSNKFCPNWKRTNHLVVDYVLDGCVKQFQCEDCHGWKERQFHPLNYKVDRCSNYSSCMKPDCTYYHRDQNIRNLDLKECEVYCQKNRLADLPDQKEKAQTPVVQSVINIREKDQQPTEKDGEIKQHHQKMLSWLLEDQ